MFAKLFTEASGAEQESSEPKPVNEKMINLEGTVVTIYLKYKLSYFLLLCFHKLKKLIHNSLSNQSGKRLTDHPEYEHLTCRYQRKGLQEKGWACCPEHWKVFNTSCYFISSEWKTWHESQKTWSGMGAHLLNFITRNLDSLSAYYVGLSDPEGKNQWQWADGSPYNESTTFWRPGEPSHRDQRCVMINSVRGGWGWNDGRCDAHQRSICEMKKVYF
ncbi:C-type lectin domain family 4 member A-like [Echinops telfairi]|uniref:C-type lectin domain family 4 member A-like n=1 Tax=Echinops telfairi TaxID=9371 RepID=A0AC55D3Y5_ECHTE|nr:C-type lectin domain family 4 member A-like [Echinops telfairi]